VSGRFDDLRFFGQWRPYQRAALAAFEKDRAAGHLSTHIVAPPGSGKTLLGVELIRRVGKRALVLAPNQGIQQQWPRAVGEFTPHPAQIAGADPLKPIACLSYQALCQLEDPEIVLGRLAQARWADERAAATGMSPQEAQREGEAFSGAAADRRARELSRIGAGLKREVARGEHAGVELRDLLSTTARQRVQQLAKLGVGVVLLDECHHLASLWGYVVRAVLGELGDKVHVIGLTATPPIGLPEAEAELYDALLGPVDFTVPTPAVVRDGHLAPYQELAWLTEPLSSEKQWLAEHDQRFRELVTALHDDADRRRVLGIAIGALLDGRAVGVRRARALDLPAERFDDGHVEAPDRDLVSCRDDQVLPLRECGGPVLRVGPHRLLHRRHVLQGRPVIDEGAHRQFLGEARNAAGVIAVKMCGEQRVNPRGLRDFRDFRDARGVTPGILVWVRRIETGKAGVDHEGFTRRRDEQRGLAALGVDEVDVERVRLADRRGSHHGGETQSGGQNR